MNTPPNLIGATPWQASHDRKLLVRGHAEAYRRYHHTPVVLVGCILVLLTQLRSYVFELFIN